MTRRGSLARRIVITSRGARRWGSLEHAWVTVDPRDSRDLASIEFVVGCCPQPSPLEVLARAW